MLKFDLVSNKLSRYDMKMISIINNNNNNSNKIDTNIELFSPVDNKKRKLELNENNNNVSITNSNTYKKLYSSEIFTTSTTTTSSSTGEFTIGNTNIITNTNTNDSSGNSSNQITNSTNNESKKLYWAKGTGYDHGKLPVTNNWIRELAEQKTLQQQLLLTVFNELDIIINHIIYLTTCYSENIINENIPIIDIKMNENELMKDRIFPSYKVSLTLIFSMIENSSLLPILEELLNNESLVDMERDELTYSICFKVNIIILYI
jgi:hypothetical protein